MWLLGKKKKKAKKTGTPSREDLLAQAKQNAQAARESIGEDTLNRIAEAMTKKQQSKIEQAKRKIIAEDPDKVRENLRAMLNGED